MSARTSHRQPEPARTLSQKWAPAGGPRPLQQQTSSLHPRRSSCRQVCQSLTRGPINAADGAPVGSRSSIMTSAPGCQPLSPQAAVPGQRGRCLPTLPQSSDLCRIPLRPSLSHGASSFDRPPRPQVFYTRACCPIRAADPAPRDFTFRACMVGEKQPPGYQSSGGGGGEHHPVPPPAGAPRPGPLPRASNKVGPLRRSVGKATLRPHLQDGASFIICWTQQFPRLGDLQQAAWAAGRKG
ncbi:hypothetical protein NDU88_005526 [Pleurodeles waltl]|uniref:Uncharacterized protein n=1 Tax=Pleurodeles waltl TaxID=8319 RepID=A0AAV7PFN9_PLEWA|nr:hypothetical protein NDU88_005526 [Pleurodeles waltl]